MPLTSAQGRAIIEAAETHASKIRVPVVVAVIDATVNLKAFSRMDGAGLASVDIAIKKARTAALFEVNSEVVWEYCKPGAPAPGLELTNGGLAPFPGGIPLKGVEGELVGAVGVSGGAAAQDFEIAQAAAAAFAAHRSRK
jgi:uncharacterized protein GlcG (DUF336 family)